MNKLYLSTVAMIILSKIIKDFNRPITLYHTSFSSLIRSYHSSHLFPLPSEATECKDIKLYINQTLMEVQIFSALISSWSASDALSSNAGFVTTSPECTLKLRPMMNIGLFSVRPYFFRSDGSLVNLQFT